MGQRTYSTGNWRFVLPARAPRTSRRPSSSSAGCSQRPQEGPLASPGKRCKRAMQAAPSLLWQAILPSCGVGALRRELIQRGARWQPRATWAQCKGYKSLMPFCPAAFGSDWPGPAPRSRYGWSSCVPSCCVLSFIPTSAFPATRRCKFKRMPHGPAWHVGMTQEKTRPAGNCWKAGCEQRILE